jgi:hypothetical protein
LIFIDDLENIINLIVIEYLHNFIECYITIKVKYKISIEAERKFNIYRVQRKNPHFMPKNTVL